MDKTYSNVARVGLLSLVALTLLIIGIFLIGKFSSKKQQLIRARFDFANSLEVGAPVRIAGVYAGKVKSIRLLTADELQAAQYKTKRLEVTAKVDADLFIPKDSVASITTAGLLSQKHLEISPGTYPSGRVTDADVLNGEEPVPIDKMLASTQKAVEQLDTTLGHINDLTLQVGGDLPSIIKGLDTLIVRAEKVTGSADTLINSNREDINSLIDNMQRASSNLKHLSHTLSERPWKMVLPGFPEKVPQEDGSKNKNPKPFPKKESHTDTKNSKKDR